jgi:hypothetical protein
MENTTYEYFIRRALNCKRSQHGADADIWHALLRDKVNLNKNIGLSTESEYQETFNASFVRVKTYINNAYDNIIDALNTNRASTDSIFNVHQLQERAEESVTPEELYEVLQDSFDMLNENNFEMR